MEQMQPPGGPPVPPQEPPITPVPPTQPPVSAPWQPPPAPGQQFGGMPPIKKKGLPRGAKIAIIAAVAALVIIIIAVVLGVVLLVNVVTKPADVANKYMKVIKAGDAATAWTYLATATQQEEGKAAYTANVKKLAPTIGKYNAFSVQIVNNVAQVIMDVTVSGKSERWYFYLLDQNGWKIRTISDTAINNFGQ